MDSFKVEVKRSFEHDLKKVDLRFIPKILDNIEKLSEEPFPPQSKKMRGSQSSYRLRVGDYRIIYQVDIN